MKYYTSQTAFIQFMHSNKKMSMRNWHLKQEPENVRVFLYLSIWRKRYHVCATQSLSISKGIRLASSSGTLNGGKDGPWVTRKSLDLRSDAVVFRWYDSVKNKSGHYFGKSLNMCSPVLYSISPGGQGTGHSAPLLYNRWVVSPVGQHLSCCLPIWWCGKAAGTCQQPHLK